MPKMWRQVCAVSLSVALLAVVLPVSVHSIVASRVSGQNLTVDETLTYFTDHNVFTTAEVSDTRRFYIAPKEDTADNLTHITSQAQLPWNLSVEYALDGPNVGREQISGAQGMVGIHITLEPNTSSSNDLVNELRPIVMFSIPTHSCTNISADDGVSIIPSGAQTVIAASTEPGQSLDFHVFADAQQFSMTPVTLAALDGDSPETYAEGLGILANQSTQLVTSVNNDTAMRRGEEAYAELISTLTALRDQEQELAQTAIAQYTEQYESAFQQYMAAYVGSYTTHLSGSIGTSTQLTALMGTAQELKGDTALSHAVTQLANAVNAVSDAHQHTGAAQEVDAVIQYIRQQGTTGLAEALRTTAGEQTRLGDEAYSAGQSQLSQAMIPYSMAYTDVYTAHLNALADGNVNVSQQFEQQAIDATNTDGDSALVSNKQDVTSAMQALAAAREHTGAGSAAKQILLRFSDKFVGASANDDEIQTVRTIQPAVSNVPMAQQAFRDWYKEPLGGQVELWRAQQIARLRAQEAREQGSDENIMSSLVTATTTNTSADIAKYAGAVTQSFNATDGAKDAKEEEQSRVLESERLANQLGSPELTDRQILSPSSQHLIDETVQIASSANDMRVLAGALTSSPDIAQQILGSSTSQSHASHQGNTRFVIVSHPLV